MDCVKIFIQKPKAGIKIDSSAGEDGEQNCCSEESAMDCCAEIRVICGETDAKASDEENCCS